MQSWRLLFLCNVWSSQCHLPTICPLPQAGECFPDAAERLNSPASRDRCGCARPQFCKHAACHTGASPVRYALSAWRRAAPHIACEHSGACRDAHRRLGAASTASLCLFVQPTPSACTALSAGLAPPSILDTAAVAAARGYLSRGADGGWATPHMHPTLAAATNLHEGVEKALLHDLRSGFMIEGLNSNLFVVDAANVLWTAGQGDGAYTKAPSERQCCASLNSRASSRVLRRAHPRRKLCVGASGRRLS